MNPAPIPAPPACVAWRHPKPIGAQGRCIGQTDLPIDRRKAKRLAHRIRQAARRHGWPRLIHTSPLQRCAQVGRQLRRWGWRHHVDASLMEMDFGDWDGQPWARIAQAEVDAWCASFLHGRPGRGESLAAMFERVARGWPMRAMVRNSLHALASHDPVGVTVQAQQSAGEGVASSDWPCLIVAHGGWMQVARHIAQGLPPPADPMQWTPPPAYGECWQWPIARSPQPRSAP